MGWNQVYIWKKKYQGLSCGRKIINRLYFKKEFFMKQLLIMIFLFFVTYIRAQEDFSKKEFEKVIKTIKQTSLYQLTDSEIYEGAVRGVLQKLDEKNQGAAKFKVNTLLIPEKKNFLDAELSGEFAGIGAVLK